MKVRVKGSWIVIGIIVLALVILNLDKLRRYLPIENLLIDVNAFPPGWQASDQGPKRVPQAPLGGRGSIRSISLPFYCPDLAGAHEEIYLFRDSQEASRYYASRAQRTFRKTDFDDLWTIPDELPFRSSNAEQSYFACDLSSSATPMQGCTYIAQYGPYIVLFDIDWIPGYSMNYADLEKILQAIDEKSYW